MKECYMQCSAVNNYNVSRVHRCYLFTYISKKLQQVLLSIDWFRWMVNGTHIKRTELGVDILAHIHSKSFANSSKITIFQSHRQKIATPPPLCSFLSFCNTVKPDGHKRCVGKFSFSQISYTREIIEISNPQFNI